MPRPSLITLNRLNALRHPHYESARQQQWREARERLVQATDDYLAERERQRAITRRILHVWSA